jgi:hypothetical protein
VRSDKESDSRDSRGQNNSLADQKLQLFSAFENMHFVNKEDTVGLVFQKQQEIGERLQSAVLSPDRRYFDDPSVTWHRNFATAVSTPDYIPFLVACFPHDLKEIWKHLPSVSGHLKIEGVSVSDIRVKYLYRLDSIVFQINFAMAFRPFLKEIVVNGETFTEDSPRSIHPMSIPIVHDIPVPLPLLQTLLHDKMEDPHVNVWINDDDDETIQYEIWNRRYTDFANEYVSDGRFYYKYAKSFITWIRKNQLRIFFNLRQAGCKIDDDARRAIIRSMNFDIMENPLRDSRLSEVEIQQRTDQKKHRQV